MQCSFSIKEEGSCKMLQFMQIKSFSHKLNLLHLMQIVTAWFLRYNPHDFIKVVLYDVLPKRDFLVQNI